MDNFAEQLVAKNETSSDRVRRIAMIVCGVFFTIMLAALSILQLGNSIVSFMGLILAVATGYGTYYFVQSSYVEYEYAFTNGELDIDKIIAKKKRIEMISADVRKFTAFGKYEDGMEESEDMTVVFASDNIASHEYYADFQHDEYGATRLVFVPDERMLEYIKKALPSKLRNQL